MTGAVALMGVAACAVTGCVTVRGEAAPGPTGSTAPSQDTAVPLGEAAQQQGGRYGLREAPSDPLPRRSGTGDPTQNEGGGAAPASRGGEGGASSGTAEDRQPPGADGAPGGPGPVVRSPAVPDVPGGAHMCDLGRRYGGWAEGSMPEQACERAYGN